MDDEMFGVILTILHRFYGSRDEGAITNEKTFMWFAVVICSIIIKCEAGGIVSSTIRELNLDSKYYTNIDDLFRSSAIRYELLVEQWADIVMEEFDLYTSEGAIVYIVDGVLQAKEGRRGCTVTRNTKQSGTQTKPVSFWGASTGTMGILTVGSSGNPYPVLLDIWFSHGFDPMIGWDNTPCAYADIPTEQQEIERVGMDFLKRNVDARILADRATMSHNSFDRVKRFRDQADKELYLVTCCKHNVVGYTEPPVPEKRGRGRPRKRGDTIRMDKKFDSQKTFASARITIYNRKEKIRYWSQVLLWGKKELRKLLFTICIMEDGRRIILATDKLDMDPLEAIRLYAHRFLCEEGFKQLKHTFLGFDYHFWSKSMPWNSFMRKSGAPHPLKSVKDKATQEKIMSEFRASSLALLMASIAQGLVQLVAQSQETGGPMQTFYYKRTATNIKVSEHDVCHMFRTMWPEIMEKYKDYEVIRFIKQRQRQDFRDSVVNYL